MTSERTKLPATTLAREAVEGRPREQHRKARQAAITAHAGEIARTCLDLDPELEQAGIENLLKTK